MPVPALFFGDSVTAAAYPSRESGQVTAQVASGFYADLACTALGWTRLNHGLNTPMAAAIGGTCLTRGIGYAPLQPYNGLDTFWPRAGQWPARYLVVFYGINDYLSGVRLDDWRAAWEAFYALVALTISAPHVIVLGLPLMTYWPNPSLASGMDAATKAAASRYGAAWVTLVGMTAAMAGQDGVHPNAAGHEFIAERIVAAVRGG
jgi:lysophospholipase L1-like esterase